MIIEEKINPLLKRKELILRIESNNNPKKEEIITLLKEKPEVVVIKKIKGNFGKNVFDVEVFIYENEDAKNKFEYIPKKIRKKLEEEKKKETQNGG